MLPYIIDSRKSLAAMPLCRVLRLLLSIACLAHGSPPTQAPTTDEGAIDSLLAQVGLPVVLAVIAGGVALLCAIYFVLRRSRENAKNQSIGPLTYNA